MSVEALVKELREESARLSGRSLDRGCADSGISSNIADKAADKLEELAAEASDWEERFWKRDAQADRLMQERDKAEAALADKDKEIAALRDLAKQLTCKIDRGISLLDEGHVRDPKRLSLVADAVNFIDEANFNAKQELSRNAGGNDA